MAKKQENNGRGVDGLLSAIFAPCNVPGMQEEFKNYMSILTGVTSPGSDVEDYKQNPVKPQPNVPGDKDQGVCKTSGGITVITYRNTSLDAKSEKARNDMFNRLDRWITKIMNGSCISAEVEIIFIFSDEYPIKFRWNEKLKTFVCKSQNGDLAYNMVDRTIDPVETGKDLANDAPAPQPAPEDKKEDTSDADKGSNEGCDYKKDVNEGGPSNEFAEDNADDNDDNWYKKGLKKAIGEGTSVANYIKGYLKNRYTLSTEQTSVLDGAFANVITEQKYTEITDSKDDGEAKGIELDMNEILSVLDDTVDPSSIAVKKYVTEWFKNLGFAKVQFRITDKEYKAQCLFDED